MSCITTTTITIQEMDSLQLDPAGGGVIKDYRPKDVGINDKQWNQIKTIRKNEQKISKQVAYEMVKDFDRWGREDNDPDYFFKIGGKRVTKEQMQNHLEKQISQRIKKFGNKPLFDMEIYDFESDPNIIGFQIDGLKEYSDSQPLYIEYDKKKKRVDNWGYV